MSKEEKVAAAINDLCRSRLKGRDAQALTELVEDYFLSTISTPSKHEYQYCIHLEA